MSGESLRDQLQATYDAMQTDDTPAPAPVETTAPVEVVDAAAAPANETTPPTEAADGRVRDEHGRFAPKDKDGQTIAQAPTGDAQAPAPTETKPEAAKPEGEGAQAEPTRVPPSLPAPIKAKFATLEPDVQQAFIGLEESVQKAKGEWAKKGERLNRYDEVFAPRREQLALRGLDEVQAVSMLFAAQDLLDRNPKQGLLELARSYGVNLAQMAQEMSGGQPMGQGAQQPGQPQGFDPNALQPLIAQALAPLQQELQTYRQQTEAQLQADANAQVDAFRNDPKNIYWEDVKEDVAWLISNGRAKTIADAYDRACWSSDAIRPLLISAQSGEQQRQAAERQEAQKRQTAERQRSAAAQQAAGSVTGAPQGAQAIPQASSSGNLRQDLQAAFEASRSAV